MAIGGRGGSGDRVLIAEDNGIQAEELRMMLEEHGLVVETARHGRDALTLARANPPNIIISDVNMPEMDGYAFCREVKATTALREIPFILVTSLSSAHDVLRGLEAGADNFIVKPYEEDFLVARIRYLLTNSALRGTTHVRTGIEIELEGKRHFVTAERHQILDLLISTYENAIRLGEEATRRGERLREAYETTAVLQRCAEQLNRLRTESDIVAELLERVLDLPFARAGWIWLLDDDGSLAGMAARGLSPDQARGLSSIGNCACHQALMQGRNKEGLNHPVCSHIADRIPVDAVYGGHASVPLLGETRTIGLLGVLHKEDRPFAHEELRVIAALGSQGASALERAQLNATLERKVVERTAELRRNRDELRRSQTHLALAQQVGNVGSVEVDLTTGDGSFSAQAFSIYGIEPTIKTLSLDYVLSLTHPEDRDEHRQRTELAKKGSEVEALDFRVLRPDGQTRWLRRNSAIIKRDDRAAPATMLVTLHDITEAKHVEGERMALQAQLTQAQKMEAVGNLTGGIAHDFNNILAIAIGNLDLLKMEVDAGSEVDSLAETALTACLKGSELTKSLLAFSRRQPLQPKRIAVNQLLRDSAKMLSRAIGERIEIKLDLGEDLWTVQIDPSQLESALVNMMVNSRDAMPDGGRILVQTVNTHLDQDYADQNAEVVAGDYVVVAVSDTGQGMPPEVVSRVFEPFFTTKEKGKGTGLGLAMVFGFVKQSGGHIKIYSEVGHGTTIRLYLPRVVADGLDAAVAPKEIERDSRPNGEFILVVEDNPVVRRTVVKQLSTAGYRVAEAEDGARAIDLIERNDPFDLVFSDVVMPGQFTGPQLAREVMQRWPKIKVLLTSGFPEGLLESGNKVPDGIMLLSKPYRAEELFRKLREVLDTV